MRRVTKGRKRSFVGFLLAKLVLIAILICGIGFLLARILPTIKVGKFTAQRYNLLLVGKSMSLLSIDLVQGSVSRVLIPNDFYFLKTAYGYGAYRATSVYDVGKLDHRGGLTVSKTVQEYFAVTVDGYVVDSGFMGGGLKDRIFRPGFLISQESDLSVFDRLWLMTKIFQIRDDRVKDIDLGKFVSDLILADGSVVPTIEEIELDRILTGVFVEDFLRDEQLRVEVVNTTNVSGLGAKAVRLLSNLGLSVINVVSKDLSLDRCRLETKPELTNSKTVSRVASIFDCDIRIGQGTGRADVSVFLGTAYAKIGGKI